MKHKKQKTEGLPPEIPKEKFDAVLKSLLETPPDHKKKSKISNE
jgi:hypothetical protein